MESIQHNNNVPTNEEIKIRSLETQIKNGQFTSKEQLAHYLTNLRNRGLLQINNEQLAELLNLYDSLHKTEEVPLDMQNYASIALEDQDLIVAKATDRVLQTLEGTEAFNTEFQQTQNEITANTQDGLANADTVFNHMANNQKVEMTLVPVTEAISREDIEIEILNKIKFFITSAYVNPYSFRVDISSGVFYNLDTSEVYEVRKNTDTNQYEIYRGGELVYGEALTQEEEPEKTQEHDAEKVYEDRRYKPKVRARIKEPSRYMGNAAFTKIGLLVINIITFALLTAMIVLLNK